MSSGRLMIYSACGAVLFIVYIVSNLIDGAPTRDPGVHWAMLGMILVMTMNVIAMRGTVAGGEVTTNDGTQEAGPGHLPVVRRLASAIDVSDPARRGRGYRVSHFSRQVGEALGMQGRELVDLEYAAWLHDIGRTALHYEVMLKPGELDQRERDVVRSHPQIGYEILRDLPGLSRAAVIVRSHHEQPNGSGYPRGLMDRDIPLGSRIIMAVSAFDSMTSDRPYRNGLTPIDAYSELRSHAGSMFFAEVVEALVQLHESRAIFEEFNPQELEMYARGYYTSRAVQCYLEERGLMQEPVATVQRVGSGGDGDGAEESHEIVPPESFFDGSPEPEADEQVA